MPDYFAPYLQARQRGNAQYLSILQDALGQKKAAENRRALTLLEESIRQQREQAEREYQKTTPQYQSAELDLAKKRRDVSFLEQAPPLYGGTNMSDPQSLTETANRLMQMGRREEANQLLSRASHLESQARLRAMYGQRGAGGASNKPQNVDKWRFESAQQTDPDWQSVNKMLLRFQELRSKYESGKITPTEIVPGELEIYGRLKESYPELLRKRNEIENRIYQRFAYPNMNSVGDRQPYAPPDAGYGDIPQDSTAEQEPTLDEMLSDPEIRALLGLQ